jgi:2-polyprenyl-6-methoxyphenol hydroxylase-like FAD-dependent oxidoreductase
MTQEQVKQEALKLTQGCQSPLPHLCINNTPLKTLTKNTLRHRLNTRPSDSQVVGNVTVAGDASHPTSPMIGQGGGMALEDAIILTQKLHPALVPSREMNQTPGHEVAADSERIHRALLDFHAERHERTYGLTYKASLRKVTWNSPDSVSQRLQPDTFLNHTLFDVGKLPTIEP